MKAVADLKIVFLVAEPITEDRAEVQRWLETEAEAWGDILQPGLEDGHRKLGYKILAGMQRFIGCNVYSNIGIAGYVWSYLNCREVVLVGKTDDNVVLDLDTLMAEARSLGVKGKDNDRGRREVMCGSGTPHRNMKPLRSDRTHMTG